MIRSDNSLAIRGTSSSTGYLRRRFAREVAQQVPRPPVFLGAARRASHLNRPFFLNAIEELSQRSDYTLVAQVLGDVDVFSEGTWSGERGTRRLNCER